MSENNDLPNKKPKLDHVALIEQSVEKIDLLIEHLAQKKRGLIVSRKDFVNWLIEKIPENLTSGDVNSLIDRFYDEEKFLRRLLKERRLARMKGESSPDFELVVRPRKNETKKDPDISDEQPLNTPEN